MTNAKVIEAAKTIVQYCKEQSGWHISDLVIYDKPKALTDFRSPWVSPRKGSTCTVSHIIERAPQSWCFVEELK